MSTAVSNRKQQNRAEGTRKNILRAAVREFSAHGLSGARTDAIARGPGEQGAALLLFQRQRVLYTAALEEVAAESSQRTLSPSLPATAAPVSGCCASLCNIFDRILTQHEIPGLMQQEMVRFRNGHEGDGVIAQKAFEPMFEEAAQRSRRASNWRVANVDPMQMMYAALGANVFYFLSAPMVWLLPYDPLAPARCCAAVCHWILGRPDLRIANPAAGWRKRFWRRCPSFKDRIRSDPERKTHETTKSDLHHHGSADPHRPGLVFLLDQSHERSATDRHGGCQRGDRQFADSGPDRKSSLVDGAMVTAGQLIATIQSDDLARPAMLPRQRSPASNYAGQRSRDTERTDGGQHGQPGRRCRSAVRCAGRRWRRRRRNYEHQKPTPPHRRAGQSRASSASRRARSR